HRPMADRAAAADRQREARIGVHYSVLLDIAVSAELDQFVVAADHRAEPDTCGAAEAHPTDQHGIRRNPVGRGVIELRLDPIERIDRHEASLVPGDWFRGGASTYRIAHAFDKPPVPIFTARLP